MTLFHHSITFPTVDPLGDGLAEDIEAEQEEPEAMTLESDINENELDAYWQFVASDNAKSPTQFQSVDE